MRKLIPLLLLICSLPVFAQDAATFDGHNWKAPYQLASPEGWGIERFLLPAGFAPDIKYKGVEDIRFAPGWAKKTSEDYWSYLFLWYLDGDIKLTASDIGQYLRDYYTGLVNVNGSAIPKEKIIPVDASIHAIESLAKDQQRFQGTVTMTDYMQQKKIILNATIHVLACKHSGKTYVIHELSPQSFQHEIWKRMDLIREQFVCADKN